jgi:hypothetical protein
MQEYLESMAAKHTWTFKARLRSRHSDGKVRASPASGLKEAVTEIKKVARTDQVAAGDGVVSLMERIWPAFQDVDTSSGAHGGAVYWARDELLPIATQAPADRKTRDKWLDRLWQAIEDDGVDYLSLVGRAPVRLPFLGGPVPRLAPHCLVRSAPRKLCTRNQRLPLQPAGSRPPSGTA